MDVVEAIKQRRSIRAFKSAPVPREILKEIIELALRAPSGSNIQPWEFAMVQGKELQEIRQAFTKKSSESPDFDLHVRFKYLEPFDSRRRNVMKSLLGIREIERDDKEKRMQFQLQGLRLWGASAAIYIYIEESLLKEGEELNVWPIFDCGLVAENIMLLATAYGIGTVSLIQAVSYPDVLRTVLGVPDSKLMLLGIAMGYPDWDDPINQFRSERVPLDEVGNWYGFG